MPKKKEKAKENPFLDKMTLIEQTLVYLNSLCPEEEEKEETKEEKKDVSGSVVKGQVVLSSKKNRGDEMFWAPTAKKKSKKAQKKTKGTAPIKHNPNVKNKTKNSVYIENARETIKTNVQWFGV